MSEYTKGPWEAVLSGHDDDAPRYIYADKQPIAYAQKVRPPLTGTAGANARLMASAPLLLEACEGLLRDIRDNVKQTGSGWVFIPRLAERLDSLEATIAEATNGE